MLHGAPSQGHGVGLAVQSLLRDKLLTDGLVPGGGSPADFAKFQADDIAASGKIIAEKKIRWAVDTSSIVESMERDRKGSYLSQHFDLIEGGKTVLATLSNDVSVELMTLDAATGKITGRWNIPKDRRNGLQSSPEVAPFSGGVALSRSDYAYDYAYAQTGRKVPSDPQYDVGLFALSKPKK